MIKLQGQLHLNQSQKSRLLLSILLQMLQSLSLVWPGTRTFAFVDQQLLQTGNLNLSPLQETNSGLGREGWAYLLAFQYCFCL